MKTAKPSPRTAPTLDFLRVEAKRLTQAMTLEEKAGQMIFNARSVPRLGIEHYNWWNECLHGVGRAGRATVFPQAIGLAATFDDALVERVFTAVSDEARVKHESAKRNGYRGIYGGLTFWTPNINIFRDPRWGRGQETYGEDPVLTARMGVAVVRGLQGKHPTYLKTAACAKHFAVHSGPEAQRHGFDARVGARDLRETYLPAFAALVEAGVESVMGAYNRVNGEPACASPVLMRILREEWGFQGHFVSDCGALDDIHNHHKVTEDVLGSTVLQAFYPGCEGGSAVADVLFGDHNPSGRLPFTVPCSVQDLPPFTDYTMRGRTYRFAEKAPLWAFGCGMSYTTFRYAQAKLSSKTFAPAQLAEQKASVSVRVTNAGKRVGTEVVQVYVKAVDAGGAAPRLRLAGFTRVVLKPKQAKVVTVALDRDVFRCYREDGRSAVEPGRFTVFVGGGQPEFSSLAYIKGEGAVLQCQVKEAKMSVLQRSVPDGGRSR